MSQQPEALRLAETLDLLWLDGQTPKKAAAELRRLYKENAEWAEKAKAWLASPEAAHRLDGYRHLAQRLNAVEQQRDELLDALKRVLGRFDPYALRGVEENLAAEAAARAAIAKVEGKQ